MEFYGDVCLNPSKHPKVPAAHYALLNSLGTGCGVFGKETELIKQITTELKNSGSTKDVETVKDFLYKDNKDNMGDKLELPFYEITLDTGKGTNTDGNARLFGRYQIQAKCSQDCREFRYGDKVNAIAMSH